MPLKHALIPSLYPYCLLPDPPWKRIQYRGSELFRPKRTPRATQVMPGPPIVLPRAPKCSFGSISASFRSPQTLKNHEHLMEGIANPAYRVFAALVAQGSSLDLQKHQKTIPRHPPDAPRAPKGSPGSSQVLPQGLQEPSPEHPQRPHGRPIGLGRCNGRLLDLILDIWGTILELFWLHFRTPAITFNIMLCCVCCCRCCCSRLCP